MCVQDKWAFVSGTVRRVTQLWMYICCLNIARTMQRTRRAKQHTRQRPRGAERSAAVRGNWKTLIRLRAWNDGRGGRANRISCGYVPRLGGFLLTDTQKNMCRSSWAKSNTVQKACRICTCLSDVFFPISKFLNTAVTMVFAGKANLNLNWL